MNAAPPSDDDLVRRFRAGDEDAFLALYRRWQGPLYRFALRMGGVAGLAEDVTQEVFMALLRHPDRYDSARGPVSAYLYGIARHQVLRRLDRDRSQVPLPDDDGSPILELAAAGPLADLQRRENVEAVRRAVLSLPLHYREVVVFCDLQSLSYEEAARTLGCPVGTVRSRLHRARELLLEKLKPAARPEAMAKVNG